MTKDLIRLQNWIYGNTLNWKLKSHSVGFPRKDETKLKKKIHYLKSSKVFKEHDSGIEFIHHENHNWIHFVLCNCSNISGWINRKCFVDAFLGEISLFLILSETLKSSDIERDFSHFNRPFISFCWWIVRFNYPSILMGKIFIAFDNLDMINLWQKWKKFIKIRHGLAWEFPNGVIKYFWRMCTSSCKAFPSRVNQILLSNICQYTANRYRSRH